MAVATFVFWLGRHKFVHIPPGGSAFFRETFSADGLRAILNLDPAVPVHLSVLGACSIKRTHPGCDQAKKMNLAGFSSKDFPAQLQTVNPILVMVFIPLFTYGIYPLLGRWFDVTPLRKIGIGLFLTASPFVIHR